METFLAIATPRADDGAASRATGKDQRNFDRGGLQLRFLAAASGRATLRAGISVEGSPLRE